MVGLEDIVPALLLFEGTAGGLKEIRNCKGTHLLDFKARINFQNLHQINQTTLQLL